MDNREEVKKTYSQWLLEIYLVQKDIYHKTQNIEDKKLRDFYGIMMNTLELLKTYLSKQVLNNNSLVNSKEKKYILDQLGYFLWTMIPLFRSSYEILINKLFEENYENNPLQSNKYKEIIKKYPDLENHMIFSDKNYKRLFSYDLISKINKLYKDDKDREGKVKNITEIYHTRNTLHTGKSITYDTINEVIKNILDNCNTLVQSGNELYYTFNK